MEISNTVTLGSIITTIILFIAAISLFFLRRKDLKEINNMKNQLEDKIDTFEDVVKKYGSDLDRFRVDHRKFLEQQDKSLTEQRRLLDNTLHELHDFVKTIVKNTEKGFDLK